MILLVFALTFSGAVRVAMFSRDAVEDSWFFKFATQEGMIMSTLDHNCGELDFGEVTQFTYSCGDKETYDQIYIAGPISAGQKLDKLETCLKHVSNLSSLRVAVEESDSVSLFRNDDSGVDFWSGDNQNMIEERSAEPDIVIKVVKQDLVNLGGFSKCIPVKHRKLEYADQGEVLALMGIVSVGGLAIGLMIAVLGYCFEIPWLSSHYRAEPDTRTV